MVITVEMYKTIRAMRLNGFSQREIAETLHISRNTVKKYWDGERVPWERKEYSDRGSPVCTEEVRDFICACFEEDEKHGRRKQKHTAKRIYDRLVEEKGFTGAESTVRRLVRQLREKPAEAFVPLAFPAGDAIQIDWGEATVYLAGQKTTVNLFCARLCYSEAPIAFAYRRQNEESFLDAFVHVFEYFGGVPKRVIFDNAKVAVKEGFGAQARKQERYAALAAHYGFDAIFCNPASGNEKGLVEGLVGYMRRNVCVPIPKANNIGDLNQMLLQKCERYLQHQIRGKAASVGEMLAEEQQALYPLPRYAFEPAKRALVRVDRFSTIRFETNNYSVPVDYCGKDVTVKALPEEIHILSENRVIAKHQRCHGRQRSIYSMEHYLPLLARKGRAILYAKPVQDALPGSFLDWLSKQDLSPQQLVELLQRCQIEGCNEVMTNPVMASPAMNAPTEVEIKDPVKIRAVDLRLYDQVLSGKVGAS